MNKKFKGNLFPVNPDKPEWEIFITMSCKYLINSWPELLADPTAEEFKADYEQRLKKKALEKNRGLFLFELQGKIVGLGNVFIDDKNRLNIAEFYIVEKQRRKGLGDYFFSLLKKLGQLNNAKSVQVEVDKHLETANAFWKSQDLTLNSSGKRNVYTEDING